MEFLIVLFSLAGIIWMIPLAHGGRLFRFATIVLLAGTVVGPDFFSVDGPIQISLDRVLWGAMLLLAVIHWRLGNNQFSKITRVDVLIVCILLLFFVSGMSQGSGPYASRSFSRWLFYLVMPAGIYLVSRLVQIRESDIRWFCNVMIGLTVYLAITALCEIKGINAAVFPKYILDSERWEFFGRGRGPLMNPVANGFLMTIGFVSCVVNFFSCSRPMKFVYSGAAGIIALGSYATLTRSVWVGLMLAVAIIGFVYLPRWVRILGLATAVMFAGALALGLKDQLLEMKRDKNLSAVEAAKSIELRPLLAIVAWEMFKDKPIAGHGFGRYFENNKPYCDDRSYDKPLTSVKTYYQHNTFLAVLVDTGMTGFSLFIGMLVTITLIGWKLVRQRISTPQARNVGLLILGALATYFCNSMFHDMLIIPMVHMFLFFMAGVAVTINQRGFAAEPVAATSEINSLGYPEVSGQRNPNMIPG
ncbi:O-antigen ligase family protein [Planctomycetes bacterium K23_9]|uniref:O-Antigen ligase n=1 Tax=Stieleria marina TaxID=1930275 RepID=A0A517NYF7_9BACT|nr:O-Antigen ligase [Planctomycetes bacterium K23_9]